MTSGKEWPGWELRQKLWILPMNTFLSLPASIPQGYIQVASGALMSTVTVV